MQIVSKKIIYGRRVRLKWIVFISSHWPRIYKDIVKLIVCNDMEIIVSFWGKEERKCRNLSFFICFIFVDDESSSLPEKNKKKMKMQILRISHKFAMTFLTNLNITHCECRRVESSWLRVRGFPKQFYQSFFHPHSPSSSTSSSSHTNLFSYVWQNISHLKFSTLESFTHAITHQRMSKWVTNKLWLHMRLNSGLTFTKYHTSRLFLVVAPLLTKMWKIQQVKVWTKDHLFLWI